MLLKQAIDIIKLQNENINVGEIEDAAISGDQNSQLLLGFLYDNGINVPQNYSLAMYWFKKSAEHGNLFAESNLSIMFEHKRGVDGISSEDIDRQSIYWSTRASSNGCERAMLLLGMKYQTGYDESLSYGLKKDLKLALHWYKKASESNKLEIHQLASYLIGTLYKNDLGDIDNANYWFNKSMLSQTDYFDFMFGLLFYTTCNEVSTLLSNKIDNNNKQVEDIIKTTQNDYIPSQFDKPKQLIKKQKDILLIMILTYLYLTLCSKGIYLISKNIKLTNELNGFDLLASVLGVGLVGITTVVPISICLNWIKKRYSFAIPSFIFLLITQEIIPFATFPNKEDTLYVFYLCFDLMAIMLPIIYLCSNTHKRSFNVTVQVKKDKLLILIFILLNILNVVGVVVKYLYHI